ncbi:MAG: hypothetical protein WC975_00735 [Phycisphaerae bacterium]
MKTKLIVLLFVISTSSAFGFFDYFDYANLSAMQNNWSGTYSLVEDPAQGDGHMARISNGGSIAGNDNRTAPPTRWAWSVNSPASMGNYQGLGIFNSDGTRFVQFLFDQAAYVKIYYTLYDEYGADLTLNYWEAGAGLDLYAIAGTWVINLDNTNGLTVLVNGKSVYTNVHARLPQDMAMHFEFATHYGGSTVDINWVQGGSPEVLQADEFNLSFANVDSTYWTNPFGDFYQNSNLTHDNVSGWGGTQGGLKSICSFGGSNNGTLTLDMLGVKEDNSSTSNDNWWGLWSSGSPWSPQGVMFGNNGSSQTIRVMVGSTTTNTAFSMTVGTLYDFRIVWTPGVKVEFFEKAAGTLTWTSIHSTTSNVPSTTRPIQIRDETVSMDVRRIILTSTAPVESAATISVNMGSTYTWVSQAGLLHGVYVATEDQIRGVNPKYWRSYPPASYQTLKNIGMETSAEFTWNYPVVADNHTEYETFVQNHYYEAADNATAIGYTVKYWEFWNEGEQLYYWTPLANGDNVTLMEREYYAFKIFYDKIRSLNANAKIVAPSSSHYWPELMEDFLHRCSDDGVSLYAVSWHAIDIQPQDLQAQIDNMTAILNNYSNLGVAEIHINEWGWPSVHPGSQMNWFYYMGKAGVDIAAKSIWGYEPIGDLLMDNGSTTVPYWAWEFYGHIGTSGYTSTTNDPYDIAIAGRDNVTSSVKRLIVSRERRFKEYCSDYEPLKTSYIGTPDNITVNITNAPNGRVIVRTSSLPAASIGMLDQAGLDSCTSDNDTGSISGGALTLSYTNVPEEKVYLVKLFCSDSLFFDGFESNNFTTGGWTNYGCDTQSSYKKTGTYAARFNSSDNLTKSLSTSNYKKIKVVYARYTRSCESDDYFKSEWYDGSSWTELESLTGNSAWTVKSYDLPAGADNNANFKLRFKTVHNGSSDYAYLDDVYIFGIPQ